MPANNHKSSRELDLNPRNLSHWIKISRPVNLLIIVFTQLLTAHYLLDAEISPDLGILILIASTVLIAASGNLINDYYDIKVDYINKPDAVIVGRYLKRRWVLLVSLLFNILGIGLGFLLSPVIGFINLLSAFFLWLYSNQLKRQPVVGNLVIGMLTGLALGVVGFYYGRFPNLLYIYAMFAFFMTLIREIIKDIEDYVGDQKFGGKTLPILVGTRKSKQIVYWLILIFFSTLSWLSIQQSDWVIIVVYSVFCFVIAHFTFRLYRSDTKKKYHQLSQYAKRIMVIGVLSMSLH
jgi:4-hydroxybenzoate polyprenyltransferase